MLMNQLEVSFTPAPNVDIETYQHLVSMCLGCEFGDQQAMVQDDGQFDKVSSVLKER